MANNTANVSASKPQVGGAIYWCKGTPTNPPTDAKTALDAEFKSLGYVSEDGLINANSPSSTNVKAWGGVNVLTLQGSKEDTFKFKLLEVLDVDVLKLVYGDSNVSVDSSGKISIKSNNKELDEGAFVFEMILHKGKIKRIYVPIAKLSELAEIVYKDDAIGYDATIAASPADDENNTHFEWIE